MYRSIRYIIVPLPGLGGREFDIGDCYCGEEFEISDIGVVERNLKSCVISPIESMAKLDPEIKFKTSKAKTVILQVIGLDMYKVQMPGVYPGDVDVSI